MSAKRLDDHTLKVALTTLAGWEVREGQLYRSFRFPDFAAAFAFLTRCALLAEAMGHHPEWHNAYSRVDVLLSTHDAGGVTDLDISFARKMNEFAGG